MLGFEIIVATNDCTDHSPALLKAFEAAGWLTHAPHKPREGQPPQKSALRKITKHPALDGVDWALFCDADELLVLHQHDTIAEFMGDGPHDFLAVVFNWRCFGQSDQDTYRDGYVHRQFQRCGPAQMPANRWFKSMVRQPLAFNRFGAHFPHGFQGDWTDPNNAVRTPDGATLPQFSDRDQHPLRMLPGAQVNHDVAQMNHYILRATESYNLKRGKPDANDFADRYTDDFFERHNRNGQRDRSAMRFKDRFAETHAAALALPDILHLHHLCCADYVVSLCQKAGTDALADERYQHHMRVAARVAANRGIPKQ